MNDSITVDWLRKMGFVNDGPGFFRDVSPVEYVYLKQAIGPFNTTGEHWVCRIQFDYGVLDGTLKSRRKLLAVARALGINFRPK